MAGELEIADDLGPEQALHICRRGDLEAWPELLGDTSAPDQLPALEDEHPTARPCEVRGRHQPIVPGTHDENVRALRLARSQSSQRSCHPHTPEHAAFGTGTIIWNAVVVLHER